MAETKNTVKKEQEKEDENIEWIVTPGMEITYNDFIDLCNLLFDDLDKLKKNPLMICGDSGVGKSMFIHIFRTLYQKKYGLKRPFNIINCSHFQGDLMRGELFGYVKGSFTGASKDHDGWISESNGGVLILEEIGELSDEVQAKLLTFLDTFEYYRVGETIYKKADVLILAATNKYLEYNVFRVDFWNRFVQFYISAIYERRIDILYYLCHLNNEIFMSLSEEEILAILSYNWPGNVREINKICFYLKWHDNHRKYVTDTVFANEIKKYLKDEEIVDLTSIKNLTLNEYLSTAGILYKENKYSPLIFDIRSRDFYSGIENYGMDVEDEFFEFFARHKFSIIKHKMPFKKGVDIPCSKDNNTGILIFDNCNVFEEYQKNLETVCSTLWLSYESNKDLLDFKEGDFTTSDKDDLEVFYKLRLFIFEQEKSENKRLDDNYIKNVELSKKMYHYRLGANMKDRKEVNDIHSMTQNEVLKEMYTKRMEMYGKNMKKAAESLGVKYNTFRDKLKELCPELYPHKKIKQ